MLYIEIDDNTIIQECKEAKAATPVFKNDHTEFWVEFQFKKQPIKAVETTLKANSNVDRVLEAVANNEFIIVADLADKMGGSEKTIRRALKELQETNKIVREGSDKKGRWIIIENK